MVLRVGFGDNDFFQEIEQGCKDVLNTITKGKEFQESVDKYKELKKEKGIETIREAIVVCSFGHYIIKLGQDNLNIERFIDLKSEETVLTYLNKIINLREVSNNDIVLDNNDVCYIDFFTNNIYI